MVEKSPELETLVGIGGSFLCPFGKAFDRNFSSYKTQPRDLTINRIIQLD